MENHRIAEKLDREGQKIENFFSCLSESQLGINVYLDEQVWQIRDVLAHFISAEKSFIKLFEDIRNGGSGAPDNFSINEFNDSQVLKMKGLDTEKLLSLFSETRSLTVEWLNGLSEVDMEKTGRHPAMGVATIGEMVKMIYLHNQIHLRDLKIAIEPHLTDEKIDAN